MNSLKISNYLLFPDNNDCFLTAMPYKKPVQAIKNPVVFKRFSTEMISANGPKMRIAAGIPLEAII